MCNIQEVINCQDNKEAVGNKLIRLDNDVERSITKIAIDNDRTRPRQVNRFLRKCIIQYQHGEIDA